MLARAIAAPFGAGGADNVIGAEFKRRIGGELTFEIEIDIGHLADLQKAPVAHTAPGGKAGQAAFACHATAGLTRCLGNGQLIAALAKRATGLEPRRPSTNDEDLAVACLFADALGMPALAPFLAHGRVLGAANGRLRPIAGDADIAADAFAYVIEPAFLDLLRQIGVSDRGPR